MREAECRRRSTGGTALPAAASFAAPTPPTRSGRFGNRDRPAHEVHLMTAPTLAIEGMSIERRTAESS